MMPLPRVCTQLVALVSPSATAARRSVSGKAFTSTERAMRNKAAVALKPQCGSGNGIAVTLSMPLLCIL